ncbi:hypothetical protein [Streptomyces sp. NRRL F-5053]|uniref:hypothetical protein n=1 Tax=Streptomyces sp. NRRL F-5053 TaxID=1463854 RepID=UPI00133172B7|nr:hypothetical protein [Streptomyces sp. NRRL F-5053]
MYILIYRREYLTLSFAPTLGLTLPRPVFTAVQIAAIPIVSILIILGGRAATFAAVVTLLLWSSVQSLRMSNHIWLALFGVLVFSFSKPAEHVVEARMLLGYLYVAAGVFKCNSEFLLSDRSLARGIVNRQASSLNLRAPKLFVALSPAAVVLGELGTGVMLMLNYRLDIAFLVCAGLHLAFSIVGNAHFALIALAFWYEALGGSLSFAELLIGNVALLVTVIVIGGLSGYVIGNHTLHGSRIKGGLADALLVGIYCAAAVLVWKSADTSTLREGEWSAGAVVVLAAFFLNFVLLFLGLKGEWAFAMFSNVRPYGKAKILGVAPRWRTTYFRVEWDGDFPKAVSDALPQHVIAQVRDGRHVVSGPVAHELGMTSEKLSAGLRLIPQKYDEIADGFVDLQGSEVQAKRGPIWVAPIISRDPEAAHKG